MIPTIPLIISLKQLNMPQVIDISQHDIELAEKILLPENCRFNAERINFIQNHNTLDLQAVPGSGKTTVLLAKLVILERKLPFIDGSGILVLSHTNAAVDEIKGKLKSSSKLFAYPNYIGTIQSFVDEFLAIPYYIQKYKTKPSRIDNEIYEEYSKAYFSRMPKHAGKNWLLRKHEPENYFTNLKFDLEGNLTEGLGGRIALRNENNSPAYRKLSSAKERILENGVLCFADAYLFGKLYVQKYPSIVEFLQRRFQYVFVDEMQDMDFHQYELLENLFYDSGRCSSVFQRIGDRNQSIYNSVEANDVWEDRSLVLPLSESIRLSRTNANVVSNFAVYRGPAFTINGINESALKPHLIIYEDSTIEKVIPYFVELIRGYKDSGQLSDFNRYPVKVIAWNTDWNTDTERRNIEKLRLVNYYKDYSKVTGKSKIDYKNLKCYLLYYDRSRLTLESIRKNILSSFLKILRLENIRYNNDRVYTKRLLLEHLKEMDSTKYEEFLLNLFNWSMSIVRGEITIVLNEIRTYIPTFPIFEGHTLASSQEFIRDETLESSSAISPDLFPLNKLRLSGIDMEISSVHAVKGQTHCATLYLESYYSRGYGNYESERLRNQFLGRQTISETISSIPTSHDLVRQSAKMAFVGFSRPTNLLCVGIHRNRFNTVLSGINREQWEVFDVPQPENET